MEPTTLECVVMAILGTPAALAIAAALVVWMFGGMEPARENSCTVWYERGAGKAQGRKHNEAAMVLKALKGWY